MLDFFRSDLDDTKAVEVNDVRRVNDIVDKLCICTSNEERTRLATLLRTTIDDIPSDDNVTQNPHESSTHNSKRSQAVGSLNRRLQALLVSERQGDRLAAVAAISALLTTESEDIQARAQRAGNAVRLLFQTQNTDIPTAKAAAALVGVLAKLNSTLSSRAVDFALTNAINLIARCHNEDPYPELSTDRARSALVITELALSNKSPEYILRFHDNLRTELWHIVWDREESVREQGVQALQAVLNSVLIADKSESQKAVQEIIERINISLLPVEDIRALRYKQERRNAVVHGSLLMTASLLRSYQSRPHLSSFAKDISSVVLRYQKTSSAAIRETVADILPLLVQIDSSIFEGDFLRELRTSTLNLVRNTEFPSQERGRCLMSLAAIANKISNRDLGPLLKDMLETCREALVLQSLATREKLIPQEAILKAIIHLSKASKGHPVFAEFMREGMIQLIMSTDFTGCLVSAMDEISREVPDMVVSIRDNIVNAIAATLKQRMPVNPNHIWENGAFNGEIHRQIERSSSTQLIHNYSDITSRNKGGSVGDFRALGSVGDEASTSHDFFKQYPVTTELRRIEGDIALASNASSTGIDRLLDSPPGSQASSPSHGPSARSLPELSVEAASDRENSPCVALKAILTYTFTGMSTEDLTSFVSEFVVGYLHANSVKVRALAVTAAAKLLETAVKEGPHQGLGCDDLPRLSPHIQSFVTQLISLAVADPSKDVRYIAVRSLDREEFSDYLAQYETLNMLCIGFHDESAVLRRVALSLASRLSVRHPARVIPALRRQLVHLLTVLRLHGNSFARNRRDAMYLVYTLTCHAKQLVKPYTKTVLTLLLLCLREAKERNDSATILPIYLTIAEMGGTMSPFDLSPFREELVPQIVSSILQFQSSEPVLRKAALRALTGVVQNTGFVIKPYDVHRGLLPGLVQLLTVETDQNVRLEAEMLIASLGAVNPENHKYASLPRYAERQQFSQTRNLPIGSQDRGTQRNYASFTSGVQLGASGAHLSSSKLAALAASEQNSSNPRRESQQVIEVTASKRGHMGWSSARDGSRPSFLNPAVKAEDAEAAMDIFVYGVEYLERMTSYRPVWDTEKLDNMSLVEELEHPFTNSPNYCSSVALDQLNIIISNPRQRPHYRDALKAIVHILRSSGSNCSQFLSAVVPRILWLLAKTSTTNSSPGVTFTELENHIMIRLQELISISGREYMPYVCDTVLLMWKFLKHLSSSPLCLVTVCNLLSKLRLAVGAQFAPVIPIVLPYLLSSVSRDRSENGTSTVAVLKTLETFSPLYDEYHIIVIEWLTNIVLAKELAVRREDALLTLIRIVQDLSSIEILPSVIQPLIQVIAGCYDRASNSAEVSNDGFTDEFRSGNVEHLSDGSELVVLASRALVEIGKRSVRAFDVYIPLIRRALRISILRRIDQSMCDAVEKMLEQRASQSVTDLINAIPSTVNAKALQPVHGSSGSVSDRSHSAHSLSLWRRFAFDHSQPSAQGRNPVCRKHNLMESVLLQKWEVQPGFSEEDWVQWYSSLGAAMLEQSGSPALRACVRISESYPPFSKLVFNAAFLSCWKHPLSSESKVKIVYNLEKALSSETIPLNVLQSLLNLYEFMDHDENPLPTSNMKLAIAACRCGAFAKAVRYRELDYAHHVGNPELIELDIDGEEGLISIYNRLSNLESAVGTLTHYQSHEGANVKEIWFEKLQKWDDALEEYSKVEIDFSVIGEDLYTDKTKWASLLGRLRCLNEIGDWRKLNDLVQDSKMACITNEHALGELALDGKGASVALDLGRWDEFEEWVRYLRPNTFHGCFYRAMVLVRRGSSDSARLGDAEDFLQNARKRLDLELTARVSEGYPRAYERVVDAQILVELEEMIAFLRMRESDSASYGRHRLRDIWDQRLRGCKHDRNTWYRLLMIRALVMKPIENKEQWLEFSTMCRKDKRLPMASEALRMLLRSYYEQQASLWSGIDGAPFIRDTYQHLFDFANWSPQSIVTIQDLDIKFSCIKLLWALSRRIEAYSSLEQCRNEYLESAGLGFTKSGMLLGFPSEELEYERVIAGEVFSKLSKWGFRLAESREVEETCITDPVVYADYATKIRPEWGKAWHYWGNLNENRFLALVDKQGGIPDVGYHLGNGIKIGKREKKYAVGAVRGYFKAIDLKSKTSTEDSLRVLTLWFNFGGLGNLHVDFDEGFSRTNITMWLEVVPQIIARLYTPYREVERGVKILLAKIGKVHPQVAVYPLTVAKNVYRSHQEKRANTATQILAEIKQDHKEIVEEAEIVANELVRVAILWSEIWCERLEEGSKLYFMDKKIFEMLETIMPLHDMMDRSPETGYEQSFISKFGRELNDAAELCRRFQAEHHEGLSIEGPLSQYLNQAWSIYHNLFRKIQRQQQSIHMLDLSFVSKGLDEARGLKLAVPGTYDPYDNSPTIAIHAFNPKLTVMQSKQRPRKLSIIGSDGEEYHFLLKGHEDLRQDERVMQIFSLVNKIFSKSNGSAVLSRGALKTYPVIALSGDAGLIGWVPGCDTIHSLVKEYREMRRIMPNVEHRVMLRIAPEPDRLPLLQKVQLFDFMLQNTGGVDIAKVLWLKSRNSEIWFERRTTFAKSLATTSMMGYLLGLGDRHPSNLMIDRGTGKVMHIDFGDCFEVAMKREKYPERVPFRLTRMLVGALEPCGVDGHFRQTSEVAMEVVRSDARQSLLSMMEAFVYDPLVRWKLIKAKDLLAFREQRDASLEEAMAALAGPTDGEPDIVRSLREAGSLMASMRLEEYVQASGTNHAEEQHPGAIPTPSAPMHVQPHAQFDFDPANLPTPAADERAAQRRFFRTADPSDNRITVAGNEKAHEALKRVEAKLFGRDFDPDVALSVSEQVQLLIRDATNIENLCSLFLGWCAFW